MVNAVTQRLIERNRIANPFMLRDVDGPGIGNSAIVERTDRPKEGGRLMYLTGYQYPYKGCPDGEGVYAIHDVKKIIHYALQSFKGKSTMVAIGLLFILPNWLTSGIKKSVVDYYYNLIEWKMSLYLLKPERYCLCVRELHRTFNVLIDRQKDGIIKKLIELARDVFCMFIEYDSAYKFRFQDAFTIADKIRMIKNIRKEILYLFGVLIEREIDNKTQTGMGSKWKRLQKIFGVALKVPQFKKLVVEFIKELDFEKMKPDAGDDYFNLLRMDYNFRGKSLEERIEERKKIEGVNWWMFAEVANNFIQNRNFLIKDVEAKFKRGA